MKMPKTKYVLLGALALIGLVGYLSWNRMNASALPDGVAAANGRIEYLSLKSSG